jgi:proton-translocating NAD(P)+ transhydrogenase subunit beta
LQSSSLGSYAIARPDPECANDGVNPDARSNQGSPIYGMPILNVDDAQTVVVLKRSMNPGLAGIENPLFYNPKTVMLFGDAKKSIDDLIADVKNR